MNSKSFISSWMASKIQDGFFVEPHQIENTDIFKLIRNTIYTYLSDIEIDGDSWSDWTLAIHLCNVLGYKERDNVMIPVVNHAKKSLVDGMSIPGFEQRIERFSIYNDCEYIDTLSRNFQNVSNEILRDNKIRNFKQRFFKKMI